MNFTWNESKRQANLAKHGLDFADAKEVFENPLILIEPRFSIRRIFDAKFV